MITRYSYLLGVVLTNRRDLLPKRCCRLCCYGLLIGRCIDNYSQEIVWHNISNAIAHRFFVQFKSMFVLKYHTRFKTFVRLIRLLSFIIIWVSFSVIQVLRYFYVKSNAKYNRSIFWLFCTGKIRINYRKHWTNYFDGDHVTIVTYF